MENNVTIAIPPNVSDETLLLGALLGLVFLVLAVTRTSDVAPRVKATLMSLATLVILATVVAFTVRIFRDEPEEPAPEMADSPLAAGGDQVDPPVAVLETEATDIEQMPVPQDANHDDAEPTTPNDALAQTGPHERRQRNFDRSHRNRHCQGSTIIDWTVKPDVGWLIDVTTIELSSSKSSKSDYYGYTDATVNGFRVRGRVGNRGECVKVFGKLVARDARGTLSVRGTYHEYRPAGN